MELPAHFEALMNRSPISQADITSFLREMRRTPSGTLVTSKLLAGKVQSTSEAQAIHAFDVLEACLASETEGSIEFRTEIGRYRFLNEIIRILSPKYLGNSTPLAVKERAEKFLEDAAGTKRKQWFPSEHSKIQAVYESLVDGGVIKRNPKFPSTEADEEAELQKSIFDRAENAAILKKLLQSKDSSDLQAANRLIKNLVEEESRRIQRRAELHSLIDRIDTSTSLLCEMLSQRQIDKEIVDELADTCRSLQQKLGGVATETNSETESLLQSSENLEKALELYEERKDFQDEKVAPDTVPSLEVAEKPPNVLSLADELLLGLDIGVTSEDLLGASGNSRDIERNYNSCGDNLLNLDIDLTTDSSHGISSPTSESSQEKKGNALDEIGRLSRELMDQSLMGSSSSMLTPESKKTNDKTPLSQIQKASQNSTVSRIQTPSATTDLFLLDHNPVELLDFGVLEKQNNNSPGPNSPTQQVTKANAEENNVLLVFDNDNSAFSPKPSTNTNVISSPVNDSWKSVKFDEAKKLLNSTKQLDLDLVDLIENLSPLNLDLGEDCSNIHVTLSFGTFPDFPKMLKIAVVTLTNRSTSAPLSNYVFQLIPPKGFQIKLLPPASMELPAWKKSFLPPPVLNQVTLMIIPEGVQSIKSKPKMRFILSYTANDETALHNGDFEIPACLLLD